MCSPDFIPQFLLIRHPSLSPYLHILLSSELEKLLLELALNSGKRYSGVMRAGSLFVTVK